MGNQSRNTAWLPRYGRIASIGHSRPHSRVTFDVRVRPEAEQDMTEAALWYEQQQRGLGQEFLDEALAVFTRLDEAPLGYELVHRSVRRALLSPAIPGEESEWELRDRRVWGALQIHGEEWLDAHPPHSTYGPVSDERRLDGNGAPDCMA